MASLDYHRGQASRRDVAVGLLVLLVVLVCLAIAGTVEGRSLNPENGCQWGEVRTAQGDCR